MRTKILTKHRLFFSKIVIICFLFCGGNIQAFDQSELTTAASKKNYAKIIEILSPEVEKLSHPNLSLLAQSYFEINNYLAAIKLYTACLSLDPKDYKAKTQIGLAQFNLGKDKEALASLKSSLEINSEYEPTYQVLINYYNKKKNKYELRLLYQDMIEKLGEKAPYVTALCELTAKDSLYDLSIKYCLKGIQLNPKEALNYTYLGISYQDTGDSKKASKFLKLAADKFPKSEVAQINYAQLLENEKNFIGAYNYYKNATIADKQSVKAFIGLGNSAVEIQKYKEALEAYQNACKLNKSALPPLRKAINTLRSLKNQDWIKKFEETADSCGL